MKLITAAAATTDRTYAARALVIAAGALLGVACAQSATPASPGADSDPSCFHVAGNRCLNADPALHPALAVLGRAVRGPALLLAGAHTGVSIRLGPTPSGSIAYFAPQGHAITLEPELRTASPRGVAAVLAHELKHVANWASPETQLMPGTFDCESDEISAVMAEIDVWKDVRGSDPPVDQFERQEESNAKAMDAEGTAFWHQVQRQYQGECGPVADPPT